MAEKLAIFDKEQTIKDLQDVNKEVDVSVSKFNELVKVVTVASYGFNKGKPKEFTEAITKTSDAISKLKKEFDLLAEVEKKQAQLSNRMAIAESEAGKEIALKTERVNALAKSNREWAKTQVANENLSNKERASLGQLVGLYDKVQKKLEEKRNSYRNLAVAKELGITLNDKEERTMARLEKSIQKYDKALKTTDATMGIHRRNVGNYASGFNALNNSVAQLTREAPAFTNSIQTGFMALSNNIPIFFDALNGAREENAKLNAEGKKGVPVWEQLSSAFFSWNTLLSVGITLLTVYGEDIYKWGMKMIKGAESINQVKEAQQNLNEAVKSTEFKKAVRDVSEMTNTFQLAKEGVISKEKALKFYNDTLGKVIGSATNLNEAEMILTKNADNYIKATLYKAAANLALDKSAGEMLKAEEARQKKLVDFDNKFNDATITQIRSKQQFDAEETRIANARKKRQQEEIKAAEYNARVQENIAKNMMKTAAGFSKGMNFDSLIGKSSTKPKVNKSSTSSLSKEPKDFLASLQANRDLELAINETKFVKGEQTEKEYLQNVLKINTDFFNKKIAYLKGKNAEERKQKADAILDQSKLEKETQKKIFDIDSGQLEEQNKIKINEFERTSKAIEENQYLTNVDRLNQQIGNDSQMIQQLTSYYDAVLELAKKANQDTLEIERKRDEEIGNIQDKRLGRVNELPGAFNDDIDRISTLSDNLQNQEYEEQRLKILQSKIPLRNKEFLLNRLDLEANKVALLNQRNDLELKKAKLEPLKEANKLTKEQEVQYSEILSGISHINAELDVTEKNLKNLDLSYLLEDLQPLKELLGNGLNDLGLDNVSKQFDDLFNKIVSGTFSARDAVVLAASAMADGLTSMVNRNKENTIASLDEQLAYTQSTTEQEIEFINQRLERLNALDELNAEQIAERNQLEDEARTLKEQQAQREKQIEAQKARAEQKAAAQQALINGALAATMTLAQMGFIKGAIPAALALGFGIAQSIAIMAKDPVPKYRVGRQRGKAEYAITQDGGREMITDKKGNIKSLGSDKGDQLTWLDKDDKVYTASETKRILKNLGGIPNLGENIYHKLAKNNFTAPTLVYNQKTDNSDYIADKIGQKFDNALRRYTHDTIIKMDGKIYVQRGANHKQQIGYYDSTTGVETYY